ncbi:hypothetical protein VTK56DRAFT_3733 [Thermocarpiscus australiensis]
MVSPVVACAVFLLVRPSTATPTVSFPINSQVPPVARIGQPFSFTFAPSTFSSSSPITYSLSNSPRWLSIDSDARRLFGTPWEEDVAPGPVAGVALNLVATDGSGSTTLPATLVVSRRMAPKVEIPLEKQIPRFGTFSSPSSILSVSGKDFSFALDPNTFSKPAGSQITYYATMADNTPLPAWISFDAASLSFTGRTPPSESLVQPPQRFALKVIASDVAGFAGTSLPFDIVVGNHQLDVDETTIALNATPGSPVSYTRLRDNVKIDGKPAAPDSVSIVSTPNMPPWLSVDNDTWHITGMPPETVESTSFIITLRDTFLDTLNLTVAIEVSSGTSGQAGLFNGAFPQLTITTGRPFSFDLRSYLSNPRDTEVSVETDPSYSWIQFDSTTCTLSGNAPEGLTDSTADIKVKAKSRDSTRSASSSLSVHIRAAETATGSGSTTSDAHPTQSPGGQLPLGGDTLENGAFNPMLLAVLLPTLLLVLAAICMLFWCFRRRKERRRTSMLSIRDNNSDSLPETLVTKPSWPTSAHSVPDPSRRFGKRFSAQDLFVSEQKSYVESRNSFLTRPTVPERLATVRLLTPDGSTRSNDGDARRVVRKPVGGSGNYGTLRRPRTRDKVNSSLSSITETSMDDKAGKLAYERTPGSFKNGSRGSFGDGIEINTPTIQRTPASAHMGATNPRQCDTRLRSPPPTGSFMTVPDTDVESLRGESSPSYYPSASTARKFSWPWLSGVSAKGQLSRLGRAMKKQPSLSTADTFASVTARLTPGVSEGNNGNQGSAHDASPLPVTKVLSQAPSSRSVAGTTAGPSPSPGREDAAPALSDWESTLDDGVDPSYEASPRDSHFNPSQTWSTVPTADEWADETVESLEAPQEEMAAVSNRSASQLIRTGFQESPFIASRDTTRQLWSPVSASSDQLAEIQGRESSDGASPAPLRLRGAAVERMNGSNLRRVGAHTAEPVQGGVAGVRGKYGLCGVHMR